MNEIDLIITTTKDGIFVTKTESEGDHYVRDGFINRRFDKVTMTIQTLDSVDQTSGEKTQ